tara:strand:+ start:1665 stop:2018 length:354 start_codon:yes stop_codon:yes gene_type:complete
MTNEFQERINEVVIYQKKFGMEPRTDSYLTKKYANKESEYTAEEVAKELVCVDYIYKNTLYGEFSEDYMRHLANLIKNKYRLTWTETWEIVRFYGPISLKLMCLMSAKERIPNFSNN